MRRGTRVGQAYVAITADGSGINEEIVNSVDEAGNGVEKSGDEAGKRYGDRFSDRFRERLDGMRDKVGARLSSRLGDVGRDAGDNAGENFVNRMSEKVKSMGDRIGSELSDRMASNPEQVRRGIDRAFSDEFADRIGKRMGDRVAESVGHSMESGLSDLGSKIEDLLAQAVSGNGGRGGRRGKMEKTLGDRIGAIFGAGSRNNFLNGLGKGVGGFADIFLNLPKVIGKAQTALSGFVNTFNEGAAKANALSGAFAGPLTSMIGGGGAVVSKGLSSIASSGPAAVGAIAAVGAAMMILVSVVNGLLAAIAALVATVASALVGALAIASAGVVALAGAAGLAVLAMMSLDNTQKAMLNSAFRPLHQEAIGLGQTMLTQLIPAFSIWSHNLQIALALAAPLANVMGGAFAHAGAILTSALSGPGVQMLLVMLTTTLPGIVTHLSGALGAFINGMAGLFSAMMPYVLQFSIYLEGIANTFANWATSAAGQNAIVDFVDRALNSLNSLWNFLTAVGGLIAAVFFSAEAQGAGNNIFDTMATAVRRFTDYISQDNRMQKWFAEGVVFAQALGNMIVAITQTLQNLNNSGVINAIGSIASYARDAADAFSSLNDKLAATGGLLGAAISLIPGAQGIIAGIKAGPLGFGNSGSSSATMASSGAYSTTDTTAAESNLAHAHGGTTSSSSNSIDSVMAGLNQSIASLQSSGASALQNTYIKNGGYMANPTKAKRYHNPYVKFAESLIKQGPSVAAQIRNALLSINKQVARAITDATRATSGDAVAQSLDNMTNTMITNAQQTVNTAQSQLNSAAQSLASAGSARAAKAALRRVHQAQANLKTAQRDQKRVQAAAKIVAAQEVTHARVLANIQKTLDMGSTGGILAVLRSNNATLADYAEARRMVADAIDKANQKLADAIAMRDQYKQQVIDSVNQFGSLLSAQAQVIDGVTQALTADDITGNLRAKLDQIRKFQDDLNKLISMGLSNDAYKQLVDAGVEQGGAYATALLSGGLGSVQSTNDLVSQINAAADGLGSQASDRLYQAGVNAAQGLVDGLMSLSDQLDSAATHLGNSIALAIKNALGIHSPSRVLIGMMDYVGDGAVIGLDAQHGKVGSAAARLADQIAVSPEVAAYAARQGTSPTVSGNQDGQKFRDLIVQTPTEDPMAVANEVLNEVIGRL